jgi:hypothetical protein
MSATLQSAPPQAAPPTVGGSWLDTLFRLALTLAIVVAYFGFREPVSSWLLAQWVALSGVPTQLATMNVWVVASVIATLVGLWFHVLKREKRFHAPILATSILLIGDAGFSILETHYSPLLAQLTGGYVVRYTPTFVAILTTVTAEMLIGRFYFGKWPHLASAYVSGISAGILIKSQDLWPFVLCGLISITSKYVFRIGDRHIWNPTNLGVTLMLFLAPQHVASLSVEAGNEIWAVLVIWFMGGLILSQLKLFHISLAFIATFIPLALFRAWWTGNSWLTEIAPITSPMFQLYIFFMITDPKTITKARWSQILVAVLVAVMETVYRLGFRDVHSLYHALFTVGPIANLIAIGHLWFTTREKKPAVVPALA